METYQQMKTRHEREIGKLPIFAAFSKKQLENGMECLGVESELQLVSLGSGMFCARADLDHILAADKRMNSELEEAMNDYEFAHNAFMYEMANHEYHINWEGDYDVISCFWHVEYAEGASYDHYLNEAGAPGASVRAYRKAVVDFYRYAESQDWF